MTIDWKEEEAAEMAAQAQQPPNLHLAELTAAQFVDIWKHFDADGEWKRVEHEILYEWSVGTKMKYVCETSS